MYQCSNLLSFHELGKVALLVHVEDDDRHVALTAESECCLVHHLETVLDRLVEAELLILHGIRILFRVSRIDAVHAGSLEKSVCTDFKGTRRAAPESVVK